MKVGMSNQNFNSLPKLHTTYVNIIKSLLPIGDHEKAQQRYYQKPLTQLPSWWLIKTIWQTTVRFVVFDNNSYVPPTYFAVLSQTLQMNMMVKEPFPFAMLGLIHVKNSVTQYRYIKDTAAFKWQWVLPTYVSMSAVSSLILLPKYLKLMSLCGKELRPTYLVKRKTAPKPATSTTANLPANKPELDDNDMHQFWGSTWRHRAALCVCIGGF